MDTNRKIAIIVGTFYLIANIAGPIAFGFELPILEAPDYLVNVSANETSWLLGALFELIMAVAVAGIAFTVYPLLKKHHAGIAIGYVGARIIEIVIYVVGVINLLTLLTLSQEFVKAGAPNASYFLTSSELLLAARDWGGHVILDITVFPLAAFMFYYLLYRSRIIPRWLSGWGLIAAVLYWAAGLLVMFDLLVPLSTIHIALQAPLGLQEMVLALWLIIKGFDLSAASPMSQQQ